MAGWYTVPGRELPGSVSGYPGDLLGQQVVQALLKLRPRPPVEYVPVPVLVGLLRLREVSIVLVTLPVGSFRPYARFQHHFPQRPEKREATVSSRPENPC
jgi:hypothetical protein